MNGGGVGVPKSLGCLLDVLLLGEEVGGLCSDDFDPDHELGRADVRHLVGLGELSGE